jgi:hypothetical protein
MAKVPSQKPLQKLNPEDSDVTLAEIYEDMDIPLKLLVKKPPSPQISGLTCKTFTDNGEDIFEEITNRENEYSPTLSLKNHNISPLFRAKMVNWMIEVLNTFDCDSQTFFTAVAIMDKYYAQSRK